MRFEIPTSFSVDYPLMNSDYYDKAKPVIRELLEKSSDGYCMYCGKRINIDGEYQSHIEHSVDKKGNKNQKETMNFLEQCKFNLALTCEKCNIKYKKQVIKVDLKNYRKKKCPLECEGPCEDYLNLKREYVFKNKIILQPMGVNDQDGKKMKIYYELFKHIYMADSEVDSEDDLFLIGSHIDRFHLNSDRFTYSVINVCTQVVDLFYRGMKDKENMLAIMHDLSASNIAARNFVQYVDNKMKDLSLLQIVKLFEIIVIMDAVP